jgi:PAS domain S-box-containing protein
MQTEEIKKYIELHRSIAVLLNTKGKIIALNSAGYKLLGYKKGCLTNKDWFENCIPKENRKEIKKVFSSIIGKKRLYKTYRNAVITKNKEKK